MPKDIIINKIKPHNPTVILVNGSRKLYSALNTFDEPLIYDESKNVFIAGKITNMKSQEVGKRKSMWFYKVKTKYGEHWKKPEDFKPYIP